MPQEGAENSVVNDRGGGIVGYPGTPRTFIRAPGGFALGNPGFRPRAIVRLSRDFAPGYHPAFPGFRPGLSSSGPTGRAAAS